MSVTATRIRLLTVIAIVTLLGCASSSGDPRTVSERDAGDGSGASGSGGDPSDAAATTGGDGGPTGTSSGGSCSACPKGCFDLQTDVENCGSCGFACQSDNPEDPAECLDGVCKRACEIGQTRCGDSCFDLDEDPSHCGSCDTHCPDGWWCKSGQCQQTFGSPDPEQYDSCTAVCGHYGHTCTTGSIGATYCGGNSAYGVGCSNYTSPPCGQTVIIDACSEPQPVTLPGDACTPADYFIDELWCVCSP